MNSAAMKNELLQYFFELSDAEQQIVLQMIKTFSKSRSPQFKPMTPEEYNKELEEADMEIEAGDFVTHEEVKKLFSK